MHLTLHWDLEWRQTRLASVRRFAAIASHVLERVMDPHSPVQRFSFDGQTSLASELIAFDPALGDAFRLGTSKGVLEVGPWLAHTEPALITGESLIRNLTLGTAAAAELGCRPRVAYCPDAGGFPAQLPQILLGCGIGAFVGWRGVRDAERPPAFLWRGPDGSEIPAFEMTHGIGDQTGTDQFDAEGRPSERQLAHWAESDARWGAVPPLWICAVLGPLDAFESYLFRERSTRQVSLGDYVECAADQLDRRVEGELRSGDATVLMAGTSSARMPEKLAVRRLERLLLLQSEPLAAMAYLMSGESHAESLRAAWQGLLHNQTEDLLRGCGIDEIYAGYRHRSAEVLGLLHEVNEEIIARLVRSLRPAFPQPDGQALMVVNPSPHAYRDVARVHVDVAPDERADIGVRDERGREVPFQLLARSRTMPIRYRDDMKPAQIRTVDRLHLALDLRAREVPPMGWSCFSIGKNRRSLELAPRWYGNWRAPAASPPVAHEPRIENDLVRVEIREDGRVDLIDKASGERLEGCHVLVDSGDAGDLYAWDPVAGSEHVTSLGGACQIGIVHRGPLWHAARCTWRLSVPESLAPDRLRRSSRRCELGIETTIEVRQGSPIVGFETTFTNRARDHKLTAWFPFGRPSESVDVMQPFHVARRSIEAHFRRGAFETLVGMGPQGWLSAIREADRSMVLLNEGSPSYEVAAGDGGAALGLTLLRSVGWLSREDLGSRATRAGPDLATPDAQLVGVPMRVRYGLALGRGHLDDAALVGLARRWLRQPLHQQFDAESAGGPGTREAREGLLRVAPDEIEVSSVKPASRGGGVVVRLWNPLAEAREATLEAAFPVNAARLCDMRERELAQLPVDGRRVTLPVAPGQVATLLLAADPGR